MRSVNILGSITNNELIEFLRLEDMNEHYDRDCSGNFILTDSKERFNAWVEDLCCGVYTAEHILSTGKKLFFAYDFGH